MAMKETEDSGARARGVARRFRRPSLGTTLGALALFVALGGSAYAAGVIPGSQIVDNSITNRQIADDNLDQSSLATKSVSKRELAVRELSLGLSGNVGPHSCRLFGPFGNVDFDDLVLPPEMPTFTMDQGVVTAASEVRLNEVFLRVCNHNPIADVSVGGTTARIPVID
jgi:hypothetical protein